MSFTFFLGLAIFIFALFMISCGIYHAVVELIQKRRIRRDHPTLCTECKYHRPALSEFNRPQDDRCFGLKYISRVDGLEHPAKVYCVDVNDGACEYFKAKEQHYVS